MFNNLTGIVVVSNWTTLKARIRDMWRLYKHLRLMQLGGSVKSIKLELAPDNNQEIKCTMVMDGPTALALDKYMKKKGYTEWQRKKLK